MTSATERYRQAVGRWAVAVATPADEVAVSALATTAGAGVADPAAIPAAIAAGRCLVARATEPGAPVGDRDPVGEVVGFAAHSDGLFGWPLLDAVVVDAAHRRQGVGSALVLGVVGAIEARGADRLFAGADDADIPARMLLGRLGFVADGYVEHAGGPDQAGARLVYVRWLNGAGPAIIPAPSEPPE
jgi:GNAT superfamily N-acetyltransferase